MLIYPALNTTPMSGGHIVSLSCYQRARNLLYPDRYLLLIFVIFSIPTIDLFAHVGARSFDNQDFFVPIAFWIHYPIQYPLALVLSIWDHSWWPPWSYPYFPWLVVPVSFGYLYLLSSLIAAFWKLWMAESRSTSK
jgi:hypothetical protein